MLQALHIKNLALVVELDVEFGDGLNTITGETGAGKSLIMGAVQLLLGGRVGPGVIRTGEKQCEVSAVIALGGTFAGLAARLDTMLEESGLPPLEDGELVLRRVVTPSGSRAYVNGALVNNSLLRTIGTLLVDIHGPHEHQSLLSPRCQLDLLDAYAHLRELVAESAARHAELVAAQTTLDEARAETVLPEEAELLRFQLREIEDANLDSDEEKEVVERHRVASHAQTLLEWTSQCREGILEADESVIDHLAQFVRLIAEIEQTDPEHGASFREQVEGAVSMLQELAADMASYEDSIDLDPAALQSMEERMSVIQQMKRKYGPTVGDALATGERIRTKLDVFERREERLQELGQAIDEARRAHLAVCTRLSEARRDQAVKLGKAISDKLRHLGFRQGSFTVGVEDAEPSATGADRVEFGFAPNPGEPVLPLRQVASSGEMARVSLAIKTVLTDADSVPILIFDEVDANIGGRVAVVVADELLRIGRRHQVVSITHLPQIAAAGTTHFEVTKHVSGERTITDMRPLRDEEREAEIIRMLGANRSSEAAVGHARELLANTTKQTG